MITLAHISDVHLAPLPPVRWGELMNKRLTGYLNWRLRRHTSLSGDGLHNLVQHMKEQSPDFVAVTGDLVNLGLEAEANIAWNWLQTVGEPAAAWAASRTPAPIGRWSSSHPTPATSAPPPSRAMSTGRGASPSTRIASTPSSVVAAIARPPPRGLGSECELRWFGTSTTERASA